jgi:hypothetical protein
VYVLLGAFNVRGGGEAGAGAADSGDVEKDKTRDELMGKKLKLERCRALIGNVRRLLKAERSGKTD